MILSIYVKYQHIFQVIYDENNHEKKMYMKYLLKWRFLEQNNIKELYIQ